MMLLFRVMTFQQLLLALLTAGGGGAVVALGVARVFGEKWLDSKFGARLQDLRHEHERQMESLRLESSRSLDRATRLSEREFEVSAEAWALVFDAYVFTFFALPGARFGVPDFSRLSDDVARRVLKSSSWDDWEIEELLAKPQTDRGSYHMERQRAHELFEAKAAIRKASTYLAKNALFLEKEVHDRLTAFVDEAWNAIVDWGLVLDLRGHGPLPDNFERRDEEFRSSAERKVKELELFVRRRFWGSQEQA
jgi:hypothetical protein